MIIPFHGAILLLTSTPDSTTIDNIVQDVSKLHFEGAECEHTISTEVPAEAPVDVRDNYSAQIRDLPKGATFLIVQPVNKNNPNS